MLKSQTSKIPKHKRIHELIIKDKIWERTADIYRPYQEILNPAQLRYARIQAAIRMLIHNDDIDKEND